MSFLSTNLNILHHMKLFLNRTLQELADNISSVEPLFRIPSLHIMGQEDPLLPENLILESLYAAIPERVTLSHIEGHNIPSIRTNIYPQIQKFIESTEK
jgi:Serine hydrolase (FSH1)